MAGYNEEPTMTEQERIEQLNVLLSQAGLNTRNAGDFIQTGWELKGNMHQIILFLGTERKWLQLFSVLIQQDKLDEFLSKRDLTKEEFFYDLLRLNTKQNFAKFSIDNKGNLVLLGQLLEGNFDGFDLKKYIAVMANIIRNFHEKYEDKKEN